MSRKDSTPEGKSSGEMKEAPDSLEKALDELDGILAEMEGGDLPLEDLIGRFEKGVGLVKFCRERLGSAEKRIQTVTKQLDGTLALEDFGADTQ